MKTHAGGTDQDEWQNKRGDARPRRFPLGRRSDGFNRLARGLMCRSLALAGTHEDRILHQRAPGGLHGERRRTTAVAPPNPAAVVMLRRMALTCGPDETTRRVAGRGMVVRTLPGTTPARWARRLRTMATSPAAP